MNLKFPNFFGMMHKNRQDTPVVGMSYFDPEALARRHRRKKRLLIVVSVALVLIVLIGVIGNTLVWKIRFSEWEFHPAQFLEKQLEKRDGEDLFQQVENEQLEIERAQTERLMQDHKLMNAATQQPTENGPESSDPSIPASYNPPPEYAPLIPSEQSSDDFATPQGPSSSLGDGPPPTVATEEEEN